MRICIIGGTGNIGSSITKLFLEQGREITCVTRGVKGGCVPNVHMINLDRRSDVFITTMQKIKFDIVIDLACFTAEDAQSSLKAFPEVGRFLFCSTVCVYGTNLQWLPTTEDHPLLPTTEYGRGKAAAENVFMEAYHGRQFPVTIIRPSTTHGPEQGLFRQIAKDFSWIDRIRKNKEILVCADGMALHQFMHVEDAARGFVAIVMQENPKIGQVYNLVGPVTTWQQYHKTAMKILRNEVKLIGLPFQLLVKANIPEFGICERIFSHHSYYSDEKLKRDIPFFIPQYTLEEGMRLIMESLDAKGRIPDASATRWEDDIIRKYTF